MTSLRIMWLLVSFVACAAPTTADTGSVRKPAVIVQGYPAFDGPIVRFALRRQGVSVDSLEKTWLDPKEYARYGLVVIVGDLVRAKIEPNKFSKDDLAHVGRFLEAGGTLLLMRGTTAVFGSPDGREFLTSLTGTCPQEREFKAEVRLPRHAWVKHLEPRESRPWLEARNAVPLRTSKGECVIGSKAGNAILYRVAVGKGQLIYVGWGIADWIPGGRQPSTPEKEQVLEEQVRALMNVVASSRD